MACLRTMLWIPRPGEIRLGKSETKMEIRMKGKIESLTENGLDQVLSEKRKEEIALCHEANRIRKSAIKLGKTQLIIAAVMGETRLYLPN